MAKPLYEVFTGGPPNETRSINVRSVPVTLWLRAKAQAALQDKPLNQWLIEAIEARLKL